MGSATLLGLGEIRALPRGPCAAWLGTAALGQVAIAVVALLNVFGQGPGPDIVFGVSAAVAALGIAATCVTEAAHLPRFLVGGTTVFAPGLLGGPRTSPPLRPDQPMDMGRSRLVSSG